MPLASMVDDAEATVNARKDGGHARQCATHRVNAMTSRSSKCEVTDSEAALPEHDAPDADEAIEAIEDAIIGTTASHAVRDQAQPVRLTMALIRQSTAMDNDLDEETELDAFLKRKALRLDWLSIGRIENLEAFTHVQELYLQHNQISCIENLDDQQELTFLALHDNRIERVENLRHLTKLKFLDLSNNCIEDFDVQKFPPSLVILRLAGNPFIRHMPSYVHLFFERLPHLVQVDQFRRVRLPASASADGQPSSVYSPRSHYVEMEMEAEGLHDRFAVLRTNLHDDDEVEEPRLDKTTDNENRDTTQTNALTDEGFERLRSQRMSKWKHQLKLLETRKAELDSDGIIPPTSPSPAMAITNSSIAVADTFRSKRKRTLERARSATKVAIADSIARFQQVSTLRVQMLS
ncbi:TPA: hypothetical protein N0F65_009938, partial [Lagenidium giganteum]